MTVANHRHHYQLFAGARLLKISSPAQATRIGTLVKSQSMTLMCQPIVCVKIVWRWIIIPVSLPLIKGKLLPYWNCIMGGCWLRIKIKLVGCHVKY